MDADEDEAEEPHECANCGAAAPAGSFACPDCDEPLDDPARGICGFCGVATPERCAGCAALVCWECSDGSRTGADALHPGLPWCADCAPVSGR